ncbi:MAG: trypsin-like peptidase domain-containing protein [Mogibacterium sp.]|nr:trypsin-like peptidase domain-containing protein [Mogibacterium sp.]
MTEINEQTNSLPAATGNADTETTEQLLTAARIAVEPVAEPTAEVSVEAATEPVAEPAQKQYRTVVRRATTGPGAYVPPAPVEEPAQVPEQAGTEAAQPTAPAEPAAPAATTAQPEPGARVKRHEYEDSRSGRKNDRYVTKRFFATMLILGMLFSSILGASLSKVIDRYVTLPWDNTPAEEEPPEEEEPLIVSPVSSEKLTTEQIVAMNADAVVEINTEIESYTFWGMESGEVAGSGVIVRQDGYIATNYHVIEGAQTITVTLHNGETYSAQVIGFDEINDIAVLKIPAEGLTAVKYGKSSELHVGDMAVAIGNPLGQLGGTATQGIVSALDRKIEIEGKQLTLLQTDSAINPGNSGGGLFNDRGELIGIVVAKTSATGIEGLGFAIPIDTAAPIIDDLIANGHVTERPAAGITIYNVTEDRVEYFGVDKPGVYVGDVYGENVKAAGLQSGDRIVALDGVEINSTGALIADIQSRKIGDEVTMTVERDGELIDITFNLEDSSKFSNS